MQAERSFRVRVAGPDGSARWQQVLAPDAAAVAQRLGVDAARLLAVHAVEAPPARAAARGPRARLFAHELAVLLDAGIPLLEALQTLNEQASGAGALDGVIARVAEGARLSAALASEPAVFDALFIAVVAAAERHGQLAPTLRAHAAYLHWSDTLRARLVAAAIYPAALLAAGGAVLLFLLLFVLPRFAGVFDDIGAELPAASRLLMAFGQAAAAHRGPMLAAAALLPALLVLAARSRALRDALVAAAWRLPLLARPLRTVALARLYRTLGVLLGAGVPAVQALQLAEGPLAAPLRPALARARARVDAGERASHALDAERLATPVARRMLKVGEGSGRLAAMLERAAGFHDDEIERLTEIVTRAVNPALMLVMGVVIGGIVVLMYLPIFTLMEQVQ